MRSLDAMGGGSNDPWWGNARVLTKANRPDHPWLAVNELISARLASALGLPVPMGEIGELPDGRLAWVSAQIALNGQEVAPADPAVVAELWPDVTAGMTVFDVLVNNVDRHDENFIFHEALGMWMIDHDQAFVGDEADWIRVLAQSTESTTPSYAFSSDQLSHTHVRWWVQRMERMPRDVMAPVFRDLGARQLLEQDQVSALEGFLWRRQTNLSILVSRSLGWHQEQLGEVRHDEGGTQW